MLLDRRGGFVDRPCDPRISTASPQPIATGPLNYPESTGWCIPRDVGLRADVPGDDQTGVDAKVQAQARIAAMACSSFSRSVIGGTPLVLAGVGSRGYVALPGHRRCLGYSLGCL